jgi:uncharacterized radical SAM superfamily Fe-S cluster-containing enzyme
MRKRCPEHGWIEALIFSDADLFVKIAPYNKPGTLPLEFATEVKDGCPYDCGLCTEHKQHACLGIIEVNEACNLDCPLCFAYSGTHLTKHGFELTYEQVDFMLNRFVETEGDPEVVQFSGGEPTLHPQILDFIELAKIKGIRHVMLNTNGIRIARDDKFLEELVKLEPTIYIQFDGFDAATNQKLRGKPDLIEDKLRALDRLADAQALVVLVAAIESGINEHEIGSITRFGIEHPSIYGINFQPVFQTGRTVNTDPMTRLSIPDIVTNLEKQTEGLFTLSDFVPVPCCMPDCNFVTYAMLAGDIVTPLPRVLDVEEYLAFAKDRTIMGVNQDVLNGLEKLWSSSTVIGGQESTTAFQDSVNQIDFPEIDMDFAIPGCKACQSNQPISHHKTRDLTNHIFMINIRDFMDPWTFHMKNMMKCCVQVIIPDGRMVPFCAYNSVGYREQVRESLIGKNNPRGT